jgi:tRNA nucleotidyltransferase/poly(A) polymerase
MADVFQFFEVGGCVRDGLLGIPTKDVDFSVVAQEGKFSDAKSAFHALEEFLVAEGFRLFANELPHHREMSLRTLTLRARVPEGHPLSARTTVADFVLARRDGPYSDGRRPDWVKPGSLKDDIFRRDMTVNALCVDVDGNLIDLVGGLGDLEKRQLRFVGNPKSRIEEDGLRVARALRFHVTKGFTLTDETWEACTSEFASEMLSKVSVERIREELNKMFRANTLNSLTLLTTLPAHTREALFRDGLRLDATLAQ